jgi:pimeloyl-ACP methyl ester carboxylesterase
MTPAERRFTDFEMAYRARGWDLAGAHWYGFASNRPGPPVLLLSGGSADGESFYPLFNALADAARPIAPIMPAEIDTVDRAVAGLIALLDRFLIDRVHLFGHAQGGFLAQRLVRRVPARVASLTLASTLPPSPGQAAIAEANLNKIKGTPEFVLAWRNTAGLRRLVANDLKSLPADEQEFWLAYLLSEAQSKGMKAQAMSSARFRIDYHRGPRFTAADLGDWPAPVQIIRFGKDGRVQQKDVQEMSEIYPRARWIDMPDTGRLGVIDKANDIAEIVLLAAASEPRGGEEEEDFYDRSRLF